MLLSITSISATSKILQHQCSLFHSWLWYRLKRQVHTFDYLIMQSNLKTISHQSNADARLIPHNMKQEAQHHTGIQVICCSVHIVAQRANWYIVAFHTIISCHLYLFYVLIKSLWGACIAPPLAGSLSAVSFQLQKCRLCHWLLNRFSFTKLPCWSTHPCWSQHSTSNSFTRIQQLNWNHYLT